MHILSFLHFYEIFPARLACREWMAIVDAQLSRCPRYADRPSFMLFRGLKTITWLGLAMLNKNPHDYCCDIGAPTINYDSRMFHYAAMSGRADILKHCPSLCYQNEEWLKEMVRASVQGDQVKLAGDFFALLVKIPGTCLREFSKKLLGDAFLHGSASAISWVRSVFPRLEADGVVRIIQMRIAKVAQGVESESIRSVSAERFLAVIRTVCSQAGPKIPHNLFCEMLHCAQIPTGYILVLLQQMGCDWGRTAIENDIQAEVYVLRPSFLLLVELHKQGMCLSRELLRLAMVNKDKQSIAYWIANTPHSKDHAQFVVSMAILTHCRVGLDTATAMGYEVTADMFADDCICNNIIEAKWLDFIPTVLARRGSQAVLCEAVRTKNVDVIDFMVKGGIVTKKVVLACVMMKAETESYGSHFVDIFVSLRSVDIHVPSSELPEIVQWGMASILHETLLRCDTVEIQRLSNLYTYSADVWLSSTKSSWVDRYGRSGHNSFSPGTKYSPITMMSLLMDHGVPWPPRFPDYPGRTIRDKHTIAAMQYQATVQGPVRIQKYEEEMKALHQVD